VSKEKNRTNKDARMDSSKKSNEINSQQATSRKGTWVVSGRHERDVSIIKVPRKRSVGEGERVRGDERN
jgi:hypothetical protein